MVKEKIFVVLEGFVCLLYYEKIKGVDMIRYALFNVRKNEEKCIDLSLLPLCKSVFYLHGQRSNLVAYICKKASTPQIIMKTAGMILGKYNG